MNADRGNQCRCSEWSDAGDSRQPLGDIISRGESFDLPSDFGDPLLERLQLVEQVAQEVPHHLRQLVGVIRHGSRQVDLEDAGSEP
jgi:hypothetical protein